MTDSSFIMEFPRLKHPLTLFCSSPTGSGKSYFVRDLIKYKRKMLSTEPDTIVWFYGIYQPLYDTIENVTFVEGLPTNYQSYLGGNTLFIIDYLMSECGSDKRLTYLFAKGSHHLNLSVIFITQNFFHKGKEIREISLNAHYLLLFKDRRDLSQIMHLGRQLFPKNINFFEVFIDVTREPFSYLLIDLRSDTPEGMRLRTRVFTKSHNHIEGSMV